MSGLAVCAFIGVSWTQRRLSIDLILTLSTVVVIVAGLRFLARGADTSSMAAGMYTVTPPHVRRGSAAVSPLSVEVRLQRVSTLVEAFLTDLARLFAGHNPPMAYVETPVVEALRRRIEPFLTAGDRLVPNFGEDAKITAQLDDSSGEQLLTADVIFEDRSIRESASGERIAMPVGEVLVKLAFDAPVTTIVDASVHAAR